MNTLPAFSRRCAGFCLGLAFAVAAQPALAGGKLAALNSLPSSSGTSMLLAPKQGVLKPSATVAGPLQSPAATGFLPGAQFPQLKAPATLNGALRSSSGAFIQSVSPPKLQSPAVPLPNGDVVLPIFQDGQFVNVSVYAGLYQVTLEATSKGGWKPVDTTHLNGGAQTVRFNLPAGVPFAALRARGTPKNKFAAGQWFGASTFVWQDDSQTQMFGSNLTLSGSVALTGTAVASSSSLSATNGVALSASSLSTNAATTTATATTDTTTTDTTTTAAVESDIWKVIGNRLFFFNQYRGMQVFDLTTPSQPVKIGALRMAAVGEQFYALDNTGTSLALLARNDTRKQPAGSAIHLLTVSATGKPTEVGHLPVSGYIVDSRLLGTRLYVLFYSWDTTSYTYKNSLVGYDLAAPESPVSLGTVDLPTGWGQQLQAAGTRLMVSSTLYDWYWNSDTNNKLSVLDVSGDGTPRLVKTVTTIGYIADQFKMNITGDTLTAVSQGYSGDNWWWDQSDLRTWVETFSLSASGTAPLAQLNIDKADGELLHATSFDGNRLYVVTCRNLDPLFIIDLTDPTNPKITGELVTPGWSAYIEPKGDRLLAVGVEGFENWKVAISWYDVSDATSPKLLSRVYPGDGVHYTWSEATYDHKAVNWDQAANRVFVPFQMWDWDAGGYTSATQVVSLANDTLTLDIAIKNTGTARRGTVVNGDLVSISGQQLVVTTNPDVGTPQQIAALELAWPVDRVAALGQYLLQIEDGNRYGWWGWLNTSTLEAVVRLSDKTDPDTVLDSVSLGLGNVIGMTQAGALVYVAQLVPQDAQNPSPQLRTWALGIDATGKIQKQSAATAAFDPSLFWRFNTPNAQAVWPTATTLVWHVPVQPQYLRYICWDPIAICSVSNAVMISGSLLATSSATTNTVAATNTVTPASTTVSGAITYAPPVGELCAMEFPVDVSSATSLTAGSGIAICIPPDGNVMSVGKAFGNQGFVFFSAQRGNQWYYGWNYCWALTADAGCFWEGRLSPDHPGITSSLHVLDFRSGLQPVVRNPVSLPGLLLSVSNVDANGAYLITDRNSGWYANGGNKHRITSLAYDSVRAHEVDGLDMQDWAAQDSAGGAVYFSLYPIGSNTQASIVGEGLNAWSGKFESRGTWQLDQPAYSVKVVGTYVLASSWGDLEVAQILPGNTLQPRASLDLPFFMWYNVERQAIDATATGIWLTAGDYGVDHFDFTN